MTLTNPDGGVISLSFAAFDTEDDADFVTVYDSGWDPEASQSAWGSLVLLHTSGDWSSDLPPNVTSCMWHNLRMKAVCGGLWVAELMIGSSYGAANLSEVGTKRNFTKGVAQCCVMPMCATYVSPGPCLSWL